MSAGERWDVADLVPRRLCCVSAVFWLRVIAGAVVSVRASRANLFVLGSTAESEDV